MPFRHLAFLPRFLAASAALALFASTAQALAAPAGASVIAGSATFASTSSALTIQTSPSSIINWNAFSVGAGETVTFAQASPSSNTLVRVVGDGAVTILGNVQSNGGLYFVAEGGVFVGASGVMDAWNLGIATIGVSDAEFLAGNFGSGSERSFSVRRLFASGCTPKSSTNALCCWPQERHLRSWLI